MREDMEREQYHRLMPGYVQRLVERSAPFACRKRSATARPGFAGPVLAKMRENIRTQMHRSGMLASVGPTLCGLLLAQR